MATTRSRPHGREHARPSSGGVAAEHATKIYTVAIASIVVIVAFLALTSIGRVIDAATQHFMLFYAGVLALIALCGSVVFGLIATDRMFMNPGHRVAVQAAHRAASFGAVAFLIVHIVTEILAQRVHVLDSVVPFLSPFRTFYIGIGTISSDLVILLVITGIMRSRFISNGNAWRWRAIHYTSYVSFVFGVWHGLLGGRPGKPYVDWSYGFLVAFVGVLLAIKVLSNSLRPKESLSSPPVAMAANSASAPMRAAAMFAQLGAIGGARNSRLTMSTPIAEPMMPAASMSSARMETPMLTAPLPVGPPQAAPFYEPGYEGPPRYLGAPRDVGTGLMPRLATGPMPRPAAGPMALTGGSPMPAGGTGSWQQGSDGSMAGWGAEPRPGSATGSQPRMPTGGFPRAGTGPMPRAATGPMPRAGTGGFPRVESGPMPGSATGSQPRMPTGGFPRAGTGPMPRSATGPMDAASGPQPWQGYGGPPTGGFPRAEPGPRPALGSGPMPNSGSWPMAGDGQRPGSSTGSQPRMPTGGFPRAETGPMPRAATGPMPRGASGPMPRAASGPQPRPGTGPMQRPGTGPQPRPGSGPMQRPQTGPMQRPQTGPMQRPQSGPMPRPGSGPMPQQAGGPMPSSDFGGQGGRGGQPGRGERPYDGRGNNAPPPWDGGVPDFDPDFRYREPGPGMPGYRGSRDHRYGGDVR